MSRSSPARLSFFRKILTARQTVTRRHVVLVAGVAGIVSTPLIYRSLPATSWAAVAPQGPSRPRPVLVGTTTLRQSGPTTSTQRFTGIVDARQTSILSAKALGRIEQIHVDLGDRVEPGQLLAQLDSAQLAAERGVVAANLAAAEAHLAELVAGPRAQDIERAEAAVAEAKANLDLRQANYRRTTRLRQSATVSAQDHDESQYALKAAEAQLASAQKALELLQLGTRQEQLDGQAATVSSLKAQLERLDVQLAEQRIEAPFGGHIQARFVDQGAVVSPGQAILELVETDVLQVHVGLPADLAAKADAESLRVYKDGNRIPIEIERVAPGIDPRTRTRELVLAIRSSGIGSAAIDETMPVGAAVEVAIDTPIGNESQWVQTQALTAGPRGLWAVYVAVPLSDDSVADRGDGSSDVATHEIERRPVELLRAQGAWSEVRGPVRRDEFLVVQGAHLVVPGQRVRCKPVTEYELEISDHPVAADELP